MNKTEAKKNIQGLIDKYQTAVKTGRINKYSEEETKKGFIEPLFNILGWDTTSDEVSAEEFQSSGGRVDYGFYIDSRPKFYLEAKAFKQDIHKEEFARQAIRYSWNKGVTWAVLTNFERIKIFNAQDIESRYLSDKLLFDIPVDKYIERFDDLWQLSKESFEEDAIDKYAESISKKLQKVSVNAALYKDISECRAILTKSLSISNPKVNKDLIDEGVQRLLDRLIFIRVAEDRKIEPPILKPILHEWDAKSGAKGGRGKIPLYQAMINKFRELDKIYNSNLFLPHSFEDWEDYGDAVEKVIPILYGKEDYYEYDFKIMSADVLGSVYENYLGYRLSKSKKGTTISKDAKKRKEQGIYYTPTFIVDYIVRNALKPVLDQCKSVYDLNRIKVLDPACGSGSFLIKAFEVISEKYKEWHYDDAHTKSQILTQNLYGVDLDEQAVEIARLNLLIAALDSKDKLPLLTDNIKNGNSLISGTDEELKKYFGPNFRDKKPFNWEEEFPEVFKQGGFDVIIGNPPYLKELDNKELFQEIKKSSFGKYYQGKMDFWYFFLHRAIDIAKKNGIVAFITNSYFLKSAGATKLISHLKDEMVLTLAVDFQDIPVFEGVSGRHLIHIWTKTKNKSNTVTKYINLNKGSFKGVIDNNDIIELPYENIIKDSSINFEYNINTDSENAVILGNIFDVSQGVVEATDKISKKALMELKNIKFEPGSGVFVLSEEEVNNLNLSQQEKKTLKKYLNISNVKKYYINFKNEYLIYSDKVVKNKIANGDYPHLKTHLDKVRQFITSSNAPYGLHRPRENKYFENQKLICGGMFLTPQFCFDDEKYYVGFSFSVIIEKDKNYNPKYLLGLLNSDFGKKWFNANGKKRGIGVDIGVAVFRKFPVYKASEKQQKPIISLVDKILMLNKQLSKTAENSNKWQFLKSEIEKTDKKIDEEVYKLYALTKKEIKIIENNAK